MIRRQQWGDDHEGYQVSKITAYGAGPLFTRLARAGRFGDIRLLAEYVKARNSVANDNAERADDMGVDSVIEVRPTPNEIARACMKPDSDGNVGLRFDGHGKLTAWRQTDDEGNAVLDDNGEERWFAPSERYRQPKGLRRKPLVEAARDEAAHVANVLSLRGYGAFPPPWVPDTRYPSFGAVFERIRAAYDAIVHLGVASAGRRLLMANGVDGDRTLEQAAKANPKATITRGKTVVAYGAEFIAGKTDSSGTATEGSFVGAPDAAEHAMIAAMDAKDAPISAVLEMALAGKTAREIALFQGLGDTKQGERNAVKAIDAAISRLRHAA